MSEFDERRKSAEEYNRKWDRIFELRRVDRSKIESMSDTELTAWQPMYEAGSPQQAHSGV